MVKRPVGSPVKSNRKGFDLNTVRGWIETAGAAVAVIGAAVGVYLQLVPPKLDTKPKPTENAGINISGSVTQTGTVNVIGNTINITGYTIEQHEARLKQQAEELKASFATQISLSEEQRQARERELKAVQSQLADIRKSYDERIAELQRVGGELTQLKNQLPEEKIKPALDALQKGDTKLADDLFATVESAAQGAIDVAAQAAFERGRIAYAEVRWMDARTHFERAAQLAPENKDYAYWAANIAQLTGDYTAAAPRFEAL
jgi:hypothetical protein